MADRIDWVAVAKQQPVLCIGQHDDADMKALNAAVRRGELVKTKAPFFGRMGSKTCYAVSHEAVAVKVEADQRAFDCARAMDEFNRAQAA